MADKRSRFRRWREEAVALWEERKVGSSAPLTRLYKFAHFWVLVWKSFTRNRCPARASALAYGTLLALIPMLAVVMSVTSSFLKKEGEARIDDFIVHFVSSVTPPDLLAAPTNHPAIEQPKGTNTLISSTNSEALASDPNNPQIAATDTTTNSPAASRTNLPAAEQPPTHSGAITNLVTNTNPAALPESASSKTTTNGAGTGSIIEDEKTVRTRKEIARRINEFIQNTRSGTLGVTGSVLLIFVAISMLNRIEDTFNDIWGVARGRLWYTRIILYWGVITLAPLLLVLAGGLASGPHFDGPKRLLIQMPFVAGLIFKILPMVVVCLTFTIFYILMPNTKVRWKAAMVGGGLAGILFHLNNAVSVLYVSRVVSNSKIYGSLGLVPVFMVGLYLAWLILLFGAQVAYAFQNRKSYVEERQVELINQRGREFVALRLMTQIGRRYLQGEPAASVVEIGRELCIPTKLIQQTMGTLSAAQLVIETAGVEPAYVPARPLETISCFDILEAMRATQGQELAIRDEPTRGEVYGEFSRIMEAERKVASAVTMLALVRRAQAAQLREPIGHHEAQISNSEGPNK